MNRIESKMHSPKDNHVHYRKDGTNGKLTLCGKAGGSLIDDAVTCTICKAKKIAGSN